MTNTIELIREIKEKETIEHHTKEGTFYYKILKISENEKRPINYQVSFVPIEEEL